VNLNAQAAAEERVLSGLRIEEGVPWAELAALDLDPRPFVELDLIADDPERLRATAAGRLVLDRLTTELLTQGPR